MVEEVRLVQRMTAKNNPAKDQKGIDNYFRMDYMGSAEFEFGALPKSLRIMRESQEEIVISEINLPYMNKPLWYVGPQNEYGRAVNVVRRSYDPEESYSTFKEPTFIQEMLEGNLHRYNGWWAIQYDHGGPENWTPFALFITEKNASLWRKGIENA